MAKREMQFPPISYKETMEAAEYAAQEVAKWPEWKQRLAWPQRQDEAADVTNDDDADRD